MVPTSRRTPPSVASADPSFAQADPTSSIGLRDWLRAVRTESSGGPRLLTLAVDVARLFTHRAHPLGMTQGQAYCGPAHGRRWDVDPESPPAAVTVGCPNADGVCYRLARDPRTQRPARDPRGRYVYVPVLFDPGPVRPAWG